MRRGGHRRRVLVASFAGVLALFAAREARAYCRSTTCDDSTETCEKDENGCPRSGAPLSWRSLPLTYRFHAGGSDKLDMDRARESIRRAFQTWSNVTCDGKRTSLTFSEGSDIPGTSPLTGSGPAKTSFGIYFRDDEWPYDDGEESLALTNQTYGKINGYIDYSDIEVNTTSRQYRLSDNETGIDLQAVITHEVGHYIGLAHSKVPSSIMVASYCESADRCGMSTDQARALADDDIAAVCALYPPSGIAGVAYDDGASSSSCSVSSSSAATRREPLSPSVVIASFAALAALFVARKRTPRARP